MWRYYNRNPEKKEEEDCVCRAISTALGITYRAAQGLIAMAADAKECEPLCVCCYHHLLEDGFGLKPKYSRYRDTVEDIARMYKDRKVIVRVDGHLTCAIFGEILDIWDCSNELVDCYWLV